jgi:hypothetical protein
MVGYRRSVTILPLQVEPGDFPVPKDWRSFFHQNDQKILPDFCKPCGGLSCPEGPVISITSAII